MMSIALNRNKQCIIFRFITGHSRLNKIHAQNSRDPDTTMLTWIERTDCGTCVVGLLWVSWSNEEILAKSGDFEYQTIRNHRVTPNNDLVRGGNKIWQCNADVNRRRKQKKRRLGLIEESQWQIARFSGLKEFKSSNINNGMVRCL